MGLQTSMEYPDHQLKDVGISGYAGGSSSALARRDLHQKEIYVPLKKRLLEKSMSQSMISYGGDMDSSRVASQSYTLADQRGGGGGQSVKKVQVNLGIQNQDSSTSMRQSISSGVKVLGNFTN